MNVVSEPGSCKLIVGKWYPQRANPASHAGTYRMQITLRTVTAKAAVGWLPDE